MPHIPGHLPIRPTGIESQEATDPFGVFQRYMAGRAPRNPFLQRLAENRFGDLHTLFNLSSMGQAADMRKDDIPTQRFGDFLGTIGPRSGDPFSPQQLPPEDRSTGRSRLSNLFGNIIGALSTPEFERTKGQQTAAQQFAPNEQGRYLGLEQAALLPTLQKIAPSFRSAFRRGARDTFNRFGSLNPGYSPEDFSSFLTNRGFINKPTQYVSVGEDME